MTDIYGSGEGADGGYGYADGNRPDTSSEAQTATYSQLAGGQDTYGGAPEFGNGAFVQNPAALPYGDVPATDATASLEDDLAALGTGPRHRTARSKVPLIVAIVVLVLLVLALVAGFFAARFHYADKAAPGVSLGSLSVSGQDKAQLTDTVSQQISASKVKLSDGKTTVSASLKDLGVSVDTNATVSDLLNAKTGNDFVHINPFSKQSVDLVAKTNNFDLDNYLNGKFVAPNDQAHPSTISFDAGQGIFVPTAGSAGRSVDPASVEKSVSAVFDHPGQSVDAKVSYRTTDMPISFDNASQAATQANVRLNNTMKIDNGNGDTFQIPGPVVASWIKPNGNQEKGEISLDFDKPAMTNYLNQTLPKQLNRTMVSQVDVVEEGDNKLLATTTKGVDGVSIKDMNAVIDQVYNAMVQSKPADVHAAVDVAKHDVQQKKSKYRVVVDKSAQMVYVYQGDQQIKSFQVCTGKSGDDETNNGDFFVYLKYNVQTMRGPGYVSPNVKWVSYFNGGEGFHTADWNYPGIAAGDPAANGSHGCVNMYEQDAQWIYDNCPEGTFVQVVGNQPAGRVR